MWDLSKSDIYPQYTVPFGTVTAMQLSPDAGDAKNPPYMVSTFITSVSLETLDK